MYFIYKITWSIFMISNVPPQICFLVLLSWYKVVSSLPGVLLWHYNLQTMKRRVNKKQQQLFTIIWSEQLNNVAFKLVKFGDTCWLFGGRTKITLITLSFPKLPPEWVSCKNIRSALFLSTNIDKRCQVVHMFKDVWITTFRSDCTVRWYLNDK